MILKLETMPAEEQHNLHNLTVINAVIETQGSVIGLHSMQLERTIDQVVEASKNLHDLRHRTILQWVDHEQGGTVGQTLCQSKNRAMGV